MSIPVTKGYGVDGVDGFSSSLGAWDPVSHLTMTLELIYRVAGSSRAASNLTCHVRNHVVFDGT